LSITGLLLLEKADAGAKVPASSVPGADSCSAQKSARNRAVSRRFSHADVNRRMPRPNRAQEFCAREPFARHRRPRLNETVLFWQSRGPRAHERAPAGGATARADQGEQCERSSERRRSGRYGANQTTEEHHEAATWDNATGGGSPITCNDITAAEPSRPLDPTYFVMTGGHHDAQTISKHV